MSVVVRCHLRAAAILLTALLPTLPACAPTHALAPLPPSVATKSEQIPLLLWYTDTASTQAPLPLAAAFAPEDTTAPSVTTPSPTTENAQTTTAQDSAAGILGMTLVNGQRFAHCRYANGSVDCTPAHASPTLRALALRLAQCTAAALRHRAGLVPTSEGTDWVLQNMPDGVLRCTSGTHRIEIQFLPQGQ